MAKKDDSLFLLEVLIDKIVFTKSPCFTDKDFRTCVNIQCTTVESLEICDDEPGTNIPKSEGPFIRPFNSGKSCLFSLKESEINEAMSRFPIKVSVYRSLPCGCLPTKVVMGEATIDMTKEFVQARNKFLEDPNSVSYQALKDSFRIVDKDGAEAGEIVMFLRISCFGKLIVTKFQGTSASPNLKTGGMSAPVDRSCVPRKDHQTPQDPCVCGATRRLEAADRTGRSSGPSCTISEPNRLGVCPAARDPYNSMPCEEFDDPCYCSGPKPTAEQKLACRNTDKYCLHIPKGRSKQFEEMGTNLNGNELKIKVPATLSIIKKISETHCSMQSPYYKSPSGGLCVTPCGKNQISLAMPSEATCCKGAQLANTQFTCTTEGCTQASKHGQQIALARGDNKQKEYTNKNSFVLKIAKTANLGDRKCKLEFEVVTPKGPDKKPPIQKINARMQSDPDCDCCIGRLKKPKCHSTLLHTPFGQDILKDGKPEIRSSLDPTVLNLYQKHLQLFPEREITACKTDYKNSHWMTDSSDMSFSNDVSIPISDTADLFSNSSTCTISAMRSRQRSVSFSETVDYFWNLHDERIKFTSNNLNILNSRENHAFGKNETTVYMTLFEESGHRRNSGTQATGFINKCIQIRSNRIDCSTFRKSSYNDYLNTNLLYTNSKSGIKSDIRNSEIYFCGKKCKSKKGMGSQQQSVTKLLKNDTATSKSSKKDIGRSWNAMATQAKSALSSATIQTKKPKQVSSGAGTAKTVSIKAYGQKPCPAIGTIKGDMMVTLSHIKICPKQQCPIHGKDPCQGPKCVAAASQQEGEQAPVKVTNVNNPRRGVFELVIRKMTGAPLARNELMLEWTPPSCRAPTCTSCNEPCPTTFCRRPSYRLSRYKLMTCPPFPCKPKCAVPCRQKCLKKLCKRSCCQLSQLKCPPIPCKKCRKLSCCGRCCPHPCLTEPCKALPSMCSNRCTSLSIPSRCKSPCPPAPCYISPCISPCFSVPCLRPCPVGRKRPRRARSHPRVKQHKKRISPCLNKSKMCPLVRCRSTFIPCNNCCSLTYCYPRKYCLSPCKSLGSCKSYCSTKCE